MAPVPDAVNAVPTPPSLVGAGVAQPPMPADSMVGMLRQQGSMPAQAMASMVPQAPPVNLGTAFGAGVLGQPYLQQQSQQFQQQQEQQRLMAQNAARMQERRAEQAAKRNEAALRITAGAMETTKDPAIKTSLAKQMLGLMQQSGMPTTPALVQAWTETGPVRKEALNRLGSMQMSKEYSPEQLAGEAARLGVPQNEIPQTLKFLQSNAGREYAGLKSIDQLENDHLKHIELQGKAFDERHKEVGRGKPQGDYASERFRQLRGKPIVEMDDANPVDVQALTESVKYGREQAIVDEQRKEQYKEHQITLRAQAVQDRADKAAERRERTAIQPGQWIDKETGILRAVTKQEILENPTKYRQLGTVEEQAYMNVNTGLRLVHRASELVDTLGQKYGYGGVASALKGGKGKLEASIQQDPDWAEFHQIVTETNIELARVISGGRLLATVIDGLSHAGVKDWASIDAGQRILGTVETSLWNRRNDIITGGAGSGLGGPGQIRPYGQGPVRNPLAPTAPGAGWGKAEVVR